MDHQLLRADRNALYHAIEKVGLKPADFAWKAFSEIGSTYSMIAFTPDERCFFRFRPSTPEWYPPRGYTGPSSTTASNLDAQLSLAIDRWLPALARHYREPDLWADLRSDNTLLRAAATASGSPYDAAEREKINKAIDAFEARLQKQFGPNATVTRELGALRAALPVLNRKDWLTLSLGTLVTIASAIHQQPIRDFLDWFAQSLYEAGPKLFG